MKRLLQRRSVQESLEAVEKEMGGRSMSLAELEELMQETGALAAAAAGKRIAADASTRYIFLTGGSATAADDSKSQVISKLEEVTTDTILSDQGKENILLVEAASSSKPENVANEHFDEYYSDEEVIELFPEFDSKVDSEDFVTKQLRAAHDFIFENSGLTQEQILAVIKDHSSTDKFSALDQPSTSKAGYSKSLEMPSIEDKSDVLFVDKTVIPSTSSCSVLDMPSTSKGIVSSYSEKKTDNISIQDKKDILISSHSSSSTSKVSAHVCDWKEDKAEGKMGIHLKLEIKEDKEVKANKMEEKTKIFQSPPDLSMVAPDKLSTGTGIPNDRICLSSLSDSAYIVSPKEHMKGGINKSNKSPAAENNSQVSHKSCTSHDPEKENRSSDEDFVEVAESDQVSASSKLSQAVLAKKAPLEVLIQTGIADLGEDIFADVFETDSEQPKIIKKEITTSDNAVTQSIDLSLDSKTASEKPLVVQKQHNEHIEEKIANDVKITAVAMSPFSNTDEVMIMSDSSEEAGDGIANLPEVSQDSSDNVPNKDAVKISTEQLQELQGSLQKEGYLLQNAQAREERLAASITDQMVQEAQELLQLFGVPYLVAPMEAEAQCAFLDRASLTDGTITDDSDIWLFGGQKVYKNFFDQKKHVLQYRDIDILHSFKLARSQLVLLALLVGSDYTTGLPGVGPVTALEILAAFPSRSKQGVPDELVEGLRRFREWLTTSTVARWDKAKLRNKLKDLELNREFPSLSVVEAYLSPKVDESMDKFSWGAPDVESIKEFARIKFGWPTSKTHEILQPIMKKMNIKITQLSIQSYFQPKPTLPAGGGNLSKRVQDAIDRIGASEGSASEDDPSPAKKSKTVSSNENVHMAEIRRKMQATSTRRNTVKGSQPRSRSVRGRGRGNNAGGMCVDRQTVEGIDDSFPSASTTGMVSTDVRIASTSSKKITSGPFAPHSGKEFILQKEKDKLNLLKNKLKAIEVFRKSARGLDKTKRDVKKKRTVLKEAHLSESSDSSN